MLELLRKLKGRSIDELRVRGVQALSAHSERYGLTSDYRLPSDATLFRLLDPARFAVAPQSTFELLDQFRKQTSAKFFAAFDDPSVTQDYLRDRFAKENQTLIERADRITVGRFDLLGFKDLCFGEPIDWHFEPISGKTSPLLHWSRIDEIDSIVTGDKKIVWELNRHQYFAALGRAYWLTQDERYAQTFANHLAQWMDKNPPKLGLNWVSSLELAFRAISWLWGLNFFKRSAYLTPDLYTRALKFLYLHARHLETYLSTYSSPNTHLTGEALGLFYLGSMLPEFRDAARWREKGERILVAELERHVLPDGVYFERASYYHRYTTEFYMHFVILSERNGFGVDGLVKTKLQSLLDHLMHITRPDGTTPLIGDDDGGQLAILDERSSNDFRAALSTGAVLFDRGDYKFVSGELAESTLWLTGSEGVRKFEQLPLLEPDATSRAFQDSGLYILRDGWTNDANYLLIDCGPNGTFNGGHAHADSLSFELAARGRTLLVDSGTYTYTGSQELRDYFRSSAAHNTLTIDGESSSVPAGPFSWKDTASASTVAWWSDERFDFVEAAHDGYQRLKSGAATHTRSVLFLKSDYWVIRDTIETDSSHRYEQHFHFAVGLNPELDQADGNAELAIDGAPGKSGLLMFSFADGGEWRIENGWVSTCYGKRETARLCSFSSVGTGSTEFYSFMIPRSQSTLHARVRELDSIGGRGFEIKGETTRDLLLVRSGSTVESQHITTDFKWAWIRFSIESNTLEEFVLIDGHSFNIDGNDVLPASEHVEYVVGRRNGDKLILEMEERVLEVALPHGDCLVTSSVAERTPGT